VANNFDPDAFLVKLNEEAEATEYGDGVLNPLIAGALGFADTASLGATTKILTGTNQKTGERLMDPETVKKYEKYNPAASLIGKGAGIIVPTLLAPEASLPGLVSKMGQGATAATKAAIGSESLAARMAAGAVGEGLESAIWGAQNLIHEEALGDANFNAESILANVGSGALLGGGLGSMFPVAGGALSGTKKAFDSLLEKGSTYTKKLSDIASQKTLGITRADRETIKAQALGGASEELNILQNIPRRAMEKGILDPFISTGERLRRASALKKQAGAEIEEAFNATDKNLKFSKKFIKDQFSDLEEQFKTPLNEDVLPNWKNLLKTIDSKGGDALGIKDLKAIQSDLKKIGYPKGAKPANPTEKQLLAQEAVDVLRGIQRDVVSVQAAEKAFDILNTSEAIRASEEGLGLLAELKPIADLKAATTKTFGKGKNARTERIFGNIAEIPEDVLRLVKDGPDGSPSALERAIEFVSKNEGQMKLPAEFESLKRYPTAVRDYHTGKNAEKWLLKKVVTEEGKSAMSLTDLATSGFGGAIGSMLGGGLGAAAGSAAAYTGKKVLNEFADPMVANLDRALKQVREFTSIDKVLNKMNKATADNIRSFMEGAKKVQRVGVAPLIPQIEAFDEVRDKINELSNSFEILQNDLDQNPFKDTMPNTTAAINNKKLKTLEFLKSKLPVQQKAGAFGGFLPPPKAELYVFYKYMNAVNNPLDTLFDELKDGTLQMETVETIKTVYPDLYKRVSLDLLLQAGENPDKLTYRQKLQLSLLFGYDLDGSLSPEAIQANQVAVSGQATAMNQSQKPKKSSVVGIREMQKSQAMLTPMQKVQHGEKEG